VSKHAGSKSRLNRKRGLACTKKFRRKNPLRRRSGVAGGSYTCRVYVWVRTGLRDRNFKKSYLRQFFTKWLEIL